MLHKLEKNGAIIRAKSLWLHSLQARNCYCEHIVKELNQCNSQFSPEKTHNWPGCREQETVECSTLNGKGKARDSKLYGQHKLYLMGLQKKLEDRKLSG